MNVSIDNTYAIILAAGASTRMGRPKQLLEWRKLSLLEHTISTASLSLKNRIIVVLGAHSESIKETINLAGVTSIDNPDWQEGIASSIRVGIQALPPSAAAVLILLCDQPLISNAQIQHLLNVWLESPTQIIACQYHHSVGVPAVFPSSFFEHLLTLKGDKGAKALLLKFENHLIKIPLPEAELDIDSPEDFAKLS